MSPVTHFFLSWLGADLGATERRDRALVTLAGVSPDLDGLGYFVEPFTRDGDASFLPFSDYHHVLCHNLLFGLLAAAVCFALAKRRLRSGLLAFGVFHLHLLCDVVGARGPDGFQWPVPYLWPFSEWPRIVWSGQWALDAWPNFVITGLAVLLTGYLVWKRGHSPLETVSPRAHNAVVRTLRNRFGNPAQEQ